MSFQKYIFINSVPKFMKDWEYTLFKNGARRTSIFRVIDSELFSKHPPDLALPTESPEPVIIARMPQWLMDGRKISLCATMGLWTKRDKQGKKRKCESENSSFLSFKHVCLRVCWWPLLGAKYLIPLQWANTGRTVSSNMGGCIIDTLRWKDVWNVIGIIAELKAAFILLEQKEEEKSGIINFCTSSLKGELDLLYRGQN